MQPLSARPRVESPGRRAAREAADPVAVPGIARLLADGIPDARLEWLEGLEHYPQLEDPAATGEALRRFQS